MAQPNTNKLVAVVFDDPYKAEEARAALHRVGGEGLRRCRSSWPER